MEKKPEVNITNRSYLETLKADLEKGVSDLNKELEKTKLQCESRLYILNEILTSVRAQLIMDDQRIVTRYENVKSERDWNTKEEDRPPMIVESEPKELVRKKRTVKRKAKKTKIDKETETKE